MTRLSTRANVRNGSIADVPTARNLGNLDKENLRWKRPQRVLSRRWSAESKRPVEGEVAYAARLNIIFRPEELRTAVTDDHWPLPPTGEFVLRVGRKEAAIDEPASVADEAGILALPGWAQVREVDSPASGAAARAEGRSASIRAIS